MSKTLPKEQVKALDKRASEISRVMGYTYNSITVSPDETKAHKINALRRAPLEVLYKPA